MGHFWTKSAATFCIKIGGAFFTCLDRAGHMFDTDKFVWLQARQVWTFSMLHNRLEQRETWLEVAQHGIEFLRAHGMDSQGNWYFALDRWGRPLVQPYNIFSDCFAALALGQYRAVSTSPGHSIAAGKSLQHWQDRDTWAAGKRG